MTMNDGMGDHMCEQLLEDAEQALKSIEELQERPDVPLALTRRLAEYRRELIRKRDRVRDTEYSIAFVGEVGVGKTTVLCRMMGLEIDGGPAGRTIPVLEVAGGRTTVCEVHLVEGTDWGLAVETFSEDELKCAVQQFIKSIVPSQGGPSDIPEEMERSIRNMSGLGDTAQGPNPARKLAEDLGSHDDLAPEILRRMNLQARTRDIIRFSDETLGQESMVWLEEIFKQVNNGLHPEFSLPRRIEVMVPQRILGEEFLNIRLVDTKGIDGTTMRDDLDAYLDDSNTIVVLCSRFEPMPEVWIQHLLERHKGWRSLNEDKVVVLGLPRHDEAWEVKDDLRHYVDSVCKGYKIKSSQAKKEAKGPWRK